MNFKTTDLCDQFEQSARVLAPVFHDFGGRAAFHGVAVTVKCFEDNSRIKELSLTPGAGRCWSSMPEEAPVVPWWAT